MTFPHEIAQKVEKGNKPYRNSNRSIAAMNWNYINFQFVQPEKMA